MKALIEREPPNAEVVLSVHTERIRAMFLEAFVVGDAATCS